MTDPCTFLGGLSQRISARRTPIPQHYAIAIVKKASGRARSDLGDLHPQEGGHTLRRHQDKGDTGLVVTRNGGASTTRFAKWPTALPAQARPHPD